MDISKIQTLTSPNKFSFAFPFEWVVKRVISLFFFSGTHQVSTTQHIMLKLMKPVSDPATYLLTCLENGYLKVCYIHQHLYLFRFFADIFT